MSRKQLTATTPNTDSKNIAPRFDPSTWSNQARLLARNEAEARLLIALLLAVFLLAAVGAFLHGVVALAWDAVLGILLPGAAVSVIVVVFVAVATYSSALARNTERVRRATWGDEMAANRDMDGDGFIGPPPAIGHVVRINTPSPVEVVLPDLEPHTDRRPLAEFPVTPNDVIYILNHAGNDGLSFRRWNGRTLPSGFVIGRESWETTLTGMVAWGFVNEHYDAAGRRHVAMRADVDVETMIAAVQSSVRAAVDAEKR